jgi:hypothetical protein
MARKIARLARAPATYSLDLPSQRRRRCPIHFARPRSRHCSSGDRTAQEPANLPFIAHASTARNHFGGHHGVDRVARQVGLLDAPRRVRTPFGNCAARFGNGGNAPCGSGTRPCGSGTRRAVRERARAVRERAVRFGNAPCGSGTRRAVRKRAVRFGITPCGSGTRRAVRERAVRFGNAPCRTRARFRSAPRRNALRRRSMVHPFGCHEARRAYRGTPDGEWLPPS